MRAIFVALLLIATGLAQAANQAVLTWDYDVVTFPTVTFNVYGAEKGQPKAVVATTAAGAKTATLTSGLVTGKAYCWQLTAVVDGSESAMSNEACKTFPAPPTALIAK